MPRYYPAYLDIKDKRCLVVGGGAVAERKVNSLLKCGAKVSVVSPDLTKRLKELNSEREIKFLKGEFKEKYLKDIFLVIGATDKSNVNFKVYESANKKNILVNIVDSPELCNFIVPSVVERGALTIAVSTGGKSPALSKKLRKELEDRYGFEYAKFLNLMGNLRKRISSEIMDKRKREEIYKNLVDSDIIKLIRNGKDGQVKKRIDAIIKQKT
ncbi:MAG: bifunctional precorrin-2 dehydrogenase/sirohydrochlorin ferrochelatase [Nitrospinae bacterium]|nr:bifunctional precorrin-2 dehydrogenase/sirohydrochlorin ferrochelatase [Nitrospinota bacterium]